MNTAALNMMHSIQYENSSTLAAPRTAADTQSFSAYLSVQLDNGTEEISEDAEQKMTLNEASGLTSWDTVSTSGTAAADAAQGYVKLAEPKTESATLAETAGVENQDNQLMTLLLMMMSNSSGASNGMSAGMLSLLSNLQGDGDGLLGTSSLSDLASILTGQVTNAKGQTIVNQAMTRLGDPYSKSKRGTGNYVDCSYLAQWAYKKAGVEIPGTAAKQAQYCYENGYEISKDELRPGDLIFWTKHSATEGRWRDIHHVAIYAGNGKIVEAKNPQNGVEVGNLWGQEGNGGDWEIVMYARPH